MGLIIGEGRVVELPNRSMSARDSFVVTGGDVRLALEAEGFILHTFDWSALTLWHSHPSGGVGPSRVDMRNKLPGVNHLVITLDGDKVIPGWY